MFPLFFEVRKQIDFWRHWAGAGGGGGGLLEASDSEILAQGLTRSAPLKGCGEYFKASPLPPAPTSYWLLVDSLAGWVPRASVWVGVRFVYGF